MKITWIGQAGFLVKACGKTILVDPYLSNSCGEVNPKSQRRMPVDESLFDCNPDILVCTHDHLDHLDSQTLVHFLNEDTSLLTLSSAQSWNKLRGFAGSHRHVIFTPDTVWTEGGVKLTSVKALHSEPTAIGVLIEAESKSVYITGDTLYNTGIVAQAPKGVDLVCLPINGVGNNMNATDAANFARDIGAKAAMPVHWGMFDALDPTAFEFEGSIIPEVYKEIEL